MKALARWMAVGCLLLVMALAACTDDDSFTSSPNYLLTFSQDTIRLDTVFSKVPSATKTFWVYNKSGNGIRCSNIRLENGNQTGFRVNVDGSYLGASAGYQVNNLEIRKNDSIRVFVELTSPLNQQEGPTKLSDNLIFSLESGVQQKVNLTAFSWDADMVTNLVVEEDMTISQEKPLIVYGGITVAEGATLKVTAPTTLYFHDGAGIDVYGKLLIEGTPEKNVVLRGDRIDHMFDYLPYDNVSGQWRGLHFFESSYDNELNYMDLHSACDAVVCDSADVSKLKLNLFNSVIHNCKGVGVQVTHAVVDIENCQVTNTLGDVVAFYGGVGQILQSTLAQFYPFDANRGVALRFTNTRDDKTYPLYDFKCINSIVTGYADDVIMGVAADDKAVPYIYHFDHCLLRTPALEESELIKEVIWEDVKDTISAGFKMFKNIDTQNLRYDFRLNEKAMAIGKADKENSISFDRLGLPRDEEPDLGCYEYVKTEE